MANVNCEIFFKKDGHTIPLKEHESIAWLIVIFC